MTLLIALPAAGASSRMRGRDKLLEPVDGLPLLRRQALAALDTSRDVLVTLRAGDDARRAALDGLAVNVATVADADTGMSASLRTAAEAGAGYDGLAILLPDVPGMRSPDIARVLAAFDGETPVRATDPRGRPGTPVVIPQSLFGQIARLTGDDGGRGVLSGQRVEMVAFDDDRATLDLDTPEEWSLWRNENTS